MRYLLLFLFVLALNMSAIAQTSSKTHTVYYTKYWKETNESSAQYIVKYEAILGTFYTSKPKKKQASTLSFPLSWHEEVSDIQGNMISSGDFSNGYYDGKWTRFYPNGQVSEITTYREGVEIKYLSYHDNGNFKFKEGKTYYRSGALEKEEKDLSLTSSVKLEYFESGELKNKTLYRLDTIIADSGFVASGELIDHTEYKNGQRTHYEEYHLNGVTSKTADYIKDTTKIKEFSDAGTLVKEQLIYKYKQIDEIVYDSLTGKRILPNMYENGEVFTVVEKMPSFKGCAQLEGSEMDNCTNKEIMNYIIQNYVYPPYALEKDIQGKEYIRFVVDEKGNVTDVSCAKGSNSLLTEYALRLIYNLPKFTPGMQRGKAVSVQYVIPINYKIG